MENLNLSVESKNGELIIREGKALELKPPIHILIEGTIASVSNFIAKRLAFNDWNNANVCVCQNERRITLTINETDPNTQGVITGTCKINPEFEKLKINTGASWTPFELADFIRMNRYMFSSNEVAEMLVKQLRDFKAKIDRVVESSKDDRANTSFKRAQAVESNLPASFSIQIAPFTDGRIFNIPIEIGIHPETLSCQLISPDANDIIISEIEKTIEEEVENIRALCPDIFIYFK